MNNEIERITEPSEFDKERWAKLRRMSEELKQNRFYRNRKEIACGISEPSYSEQEDNKRKESLSDDQKQPIDPRNFIH